MRSEIDPSHQPESQHPRMSVYQFDKGATAATRMKNMWPNLAPVINESLAKLTEFVLRDYVSVWYSKVDQQVVYDDPESSSPNMTTADSCSELSPQNKRPSTASEVEGGHIH